MKTIILASASPYKKAAMEKTGLSFTAIDSETEEKDLPRRDPYDLVKTLSKRKAKAVFEKHPDAIVIGIDSVAHHQGAILEKPKDKEEAKKRLKRLSGQEHDAITGVTVTSKDKTETKVVETKIRFRQLDDEEIEAYVEQDPDVTSYCLGYDPEGVTSSTFIESITGSYHNLLTGAPIETIHQMVKECRAQEKSL